MTVVRPRGRRLAGVVLAVGLSALLVACGGAAGGDGSDGGDGGDREIPSLATGPATAGDATETPERPLIRSDTSPEEVERMEAEHHRCLEEHGVKLIPPGPGSDQPDEPAAGEVSAEQIETENAAHAACEHKEPERLWQRAQRLDPDYADKLREWVTCIRSHGIDAWESDGFLSFHSLPPDDEMEKVDECEERAFA